MVKVMEKVNENYVKNVMVARKGDRKVKVFDVTVGGAMGFLDPVSKWGDIKIEGRKEKSLSLMGVWEGLKVYKNKDKVDLRYLVNEKMVGKVRDCKCYGKVVGVRWGNDVLGVDEGVRLIFKDMYKEEVMKRYGKVIEGLRKLSKEMDFVLLDYKDEDRKIPISHVEVLKELIES